MHKLKLINEYTEDPSGVGRFESKLIDLDTGDDLFEKYSITKVSIVLDANNADRPQVTLTLYDIDIDLVALTSDFTLRGAL